MKLISLSNSVYLIIVLILVILPFSVAVYAKIDVLVPNGKVPKSSAIVVNKNLYPSQFFYHLHIPKTGGQSLGHAIHSSATDPMYNCHLSPCCKDSMTQNNKLVETVKGYGNCSFLSYEMSPEQVDRVMSIPGNNYKGISFFRDPMEHALSALQHMSAHHKEGCKSAKEYLSGKHCLMYNLTNLQTRVMGYDSTTKNGLSLSKAIERMNKLFFVGLTEQYVASICLLRYQLGQFRKSECDCRRSQAEDGTLIPRTQNTGSYDSDKLAYSHTDILQLRSSLELDYTLYEHAKMLFYQRVAALEEKLNIQMICPDNVIGMHSAVELRLYASSVDDRG